MVLMRWLKWESLPWHLNRKSIFFKIFSRRLTYIGKLNIKVASTYSSCNPEMKNQINKDYNDKKTCLYEVLTKASPAKLDESTIFFLIKNICISSHKVYFNSTNSVDCMKGTVKRKVLLYLKFYTSYVYPNVSSKADKYFLARLWSSISIARSKSFAPAMISSSDCLSRNQVNPLQF